MTRKWIYPVLLTGLFALLIRLSLPAGCVYGSTTDWLSQHTALAETIRTAMLEQKTLLPTYLSLGGGSNGFQFSYYGYLRPDILLGCLLPAVSMYKIVIAYALGGYLLSVLLFYLLLRRHNLSGFDSFMGSVLFLTASCFFPYTPAADVRELYAVPAAGPAGGKKEPPGGCRPCCRCGCCSSASTASTMHRPASWSSAGTGPGYPVDISSSPGLSPAPWRLSGFCTSLPTACPF